MTVQPISSCDNVAVGVLPGQGGGRERGVGRSSVGEALALVAAAVCAGVHSHTCRTLLQRMQGNCKCRTLSLHITAVAPVCCFNKVAVGLMPGQGVVWGRVLPAAMQHA